MCGWPGRPGRTKCARTPPNASDELCPDERAGKGPRRRGFGAAAEPADRQAETPATQTNRAQLPEQLRAGNALPHPRGEAALEKRPRTRAQRPTAHAPCDTRHRRRPGAAARMRTPTEAQRNFTTHSKIMLTARAFHQCYNAQAVSMRPSGDRGHLRKHQRRLLGNLIPIPSRPRQHRQAPAMLADAGYCSPQPARHSSAPHAPSSMSHRVRAAQPRRARAPSQVAPASSASRTLQPKAAHLSRRKHRQPSFQ